jgi:hypothetical protein
MEDRPHLNVLIDKSTGAVLIVAGTTNIHMSPEQAEILAYMLLTGSAELHART